MVPPAAVLFDVDFTLAKPGPLLGPEGYQRAGARLDLALEGSELVTVPAAFTLFTGRDHWELLLRARAVENQLYVAAANQWGTHLPGLSSYGRSMIIDPWGVVLAVAPDEDTVIAVEIDKARMARIRESLPSLANRRPTAYRWPVVA